MYLYTYIQNCACRPASSSRHLLHLEVERAAFHAVVDKVPPRAIPPNNEVDCHLLMSMHPISLSICNASHTPSHARPLPMLLDIRVLWMPNPPHMPRAEWAVAALASLQAAIDVAAEAAHTIAHLWRHALVPWHARLPPPNVSIRGGRRKNALFI